MRRKDLFLKEHYNKVKIYNNIYNHTYDQNENLILFETTKQTITLSNSHHGRLGNQIIRNLCVSIIAKKFNLYVIYSNYDKIRSLGIDLFVGSNVYNNRIKLTEENFFEILEKDTLDSNLDANNCFFQTKEITNYIYNYLHNEILVEEKIKDTNNSNCFIHIRLGDVSSHNPGIEYYLKAINMITFDKLYISSDDPNHSIIKLIIEKYPVSDVLLLDEIETIKFGSSCRNIILSHGSFSAVIGYLSTGSNVYYPKYKDGHIWHGDIFSIPSWTMIEY